MADGVPTDPPNTKTLSWAAMVKKLWGDEWHKKETIYEFSDGREFKSTDADETGIYRNS